MSVIDKVLQVMDSAERETYICYLREVVKDAPGIDRKSVV